MENCSSFGCSGSWPSPTTTRTSAARTSCPPPTPIRPPGPRCQSTTLPPQVRRTTTLLFLLSTERRLSQFTSLALYFTFFCIYFDVLDHPNVYFLKFILYFKCPFCVPSSLVDTHRLSFLPISSFLPITIELALDLHFVVLIPFFFCFEFVSCVYFECIRCAIVHLCCSGVSIISNLGRVQVSSRLVVMCRVWLWVSQVLWLCKCLLLSVSVNDVWPIFIWRGSFKSLSQEGLIRGPDKHI